MNPPMKQLQIADLMNMLDSTEVLIMDTETTGFGRSAEIIEISIIDTTGSTRYNELVMPQGSISEPASRVHGLYEEDLHEAKAKPWPEHHQTVAGLLGGRTVIGWNVGFGENMLRQTCGLHALELPDIRFIDLLEFYKGHRRRGSNSLEHAIAAEEVKVRGDLHRALTDCHAVLGVLRKLVQ